MEATNEPGTNHAGAQSPLERKVIRQILIEETSLLLQHSKQEGSKEQYQAALHFATLAQGMSCALAILDRRCGV